ncbi:MAG: hypothetical protein ABIQ89_01435 [Candidatus Saccharimonadales bacterium]
MEIPRINGLNNGERPTGSRYSFSSQRLARVDRLVVHPSAKVRTLEYPAADAEHEVTRDKLRNSGVLLGHQLDRAGSVDLFRIPAASRPIIYDAHSEAKGAFSYGDDQLFYDLGELLAKTYKVTDGGLVTSKVGEDIAFVEFTQPAERRLFLVPGVEQAITALPEVTDPIDYYVTKIKDELATTDRELLAYFRMGFSEEGN